MTLCLGSQHRSPLQNPSTSVLRGRLVSSCSSLPSNPCLHVLSCHVSTGPPVVSLQDLSHRFRLSPRKSLTTSCAAGRQQGCEAFHMTVTNSFCMPSRFLPDWSRRRMTRCRPVLQHTRFMARKVCFSYVLKNRSSPTTSLNTKEWGERLTVGPAGRFCASQAPQLCLAAARMNLRLATPRRNTRTNVRFDGCPCSHESSKFVSNESDKDCSVSSSWSSSVIVFSAGCSPPSSPCLVTVKESEIVTSSCMWL